MKVAIIGLGNIGSALFKGISTKESLLIFDKNHRLIEKLQPENISRNSIETILLSSDIVFLCIRSNQVKDFLSKHSSKISKKTVVFFQAGFSLSDVDKYRGSGLVFIRAITNINVAARNGYTVLLKNELVKEYASVLNLLKSVGDVQEVQTENELESVALLPGCTPAIVALLVHYLEGIAKRYGIDKNSNKDAIFAAVSGTIATMRQSENPSLEIAKSVASPGGKVEKAIAEIIDSQNFEQVLTSFFDEITKH